MLRLCDHRRRFADEKLLQDPARDTELEQRIQREIMQCTRGRVRRLRVEVSRGAIAVEGVTTSYYVKQLAIKALMDVVATLSETPSITVEISLDEAAGLRRGAYSR